MAARHDPIPEDLLTHLQRTVPGFRNESMPHQMSLVRMAWTGGSKRRRHVWFHGWASYSYRELARSFGRAGFDAVNDRLQFFEVTPNWSIEKRFTKGYRLSAPVRECVDAYLRKGWKKLTPLLYGDGRILRTLPKAVASKGMDGMTTTAWRRAKELNKAPVDLVSLERLYGHLIACQRDISEGRASPTLFQDISYMGADQSERLAAVLEDTRKILRMAKTDVAGNGYVMHHYVQARSGRLYAQGINLQTTPRLIKQAALAGLWEYDFANCHYAIVDQMAAAAGYECLVIRDYLNNKQAVRKRIATAAGIHIEDAKRCLLAIMYGARATEWEGGAIPQAIGEEATRRLYACDDFARIHADIKAARAAILKQAPQSRNGRILNARGKAIIKTRPPAELLAHLVQGIESKALLAAIDLCPNQIVLVQHDGFAATSKLKIAAIEAAVTKATGYTLRLEESIIQPDTDAYFSRPQNPKRKRH